MDKRITKLRICRLIDPITSNCASKIVSITINIQSREREWVTSYNFATNTETIDN